MATSRAEIESRIIELAEKSFKAFCGDISGMFSIDIVCNPQQLCTETVNGLKNRFKGFVAVYAVKAEGELDGTFHLVFDRQGLFILAGVVAMHPEDVILEHIKSGSLEKADEITNIVMEVGDALIGAWDRIFKKELDGHGRFAQTNTFIGSPWDDSKKKIGVAGNEKSMFVPIEMTVGPFPVFNCGVIFPKAILAGTSESKSKETKAGEDVKEVERKDSDVSEAVEKSESQEAEDQKDAAQETKAQDNTEEAKPGAEEAVVTDESAAEQEPETPEEQKPEATGQQQPEVATDREPEDTKEEPPEDVQDEKSEKAAENGPEAEPEKELEASTREGPEASIEQETEDAPEQKGDNVDAKAPLTTETDKRSEHPISETIKKMTRSSAALPGEPTPSVEAEELPLSSDALLNLCAKDIMQKNVIWGDPDDSVQKALAKIQQCDAGYMMIGRGQIPEGVVSKSDLTGALSPYLRPTFAKWRRPMDDATLQIKLKWVMSRPICTVSPETSLQAMMEHIYKAGRLCLPVVDRQDRVQGIVTVFDIFKVLLKGSCHS